jgi:hypothetical protein
MAGQLWASASPSRCSPSGLPIAPRQKRYANSERTASVRTSMDAPHSPGLLTEDRLTGARHAAHKVRSKAVSIHVRNHRRRESQQGPDCDCDQEGSLVRCSRRRARPVPDAPCSRPYRILGPRSRGIRSRLVSGSARWLASRHGLLGRCPKRRVGGEPPCEPKRRGFLWTSLRTDGCRLRRPIRLKLAPACTTAEEQHGCSPRPSPLPSASQS